MDVKSLKPLKDRWPADQSVILSFLDALRSFGSTLSLNEHDSQIIARFAETNHFTYTKYSVNPPVRSKHYSPAWIPASLPFYKAAYVHEIVGTFSNYPIKMCLEYAPASTGKENDKVQNIARRSIIRVQLPKTFPQLLLDSNKNDRGITSTIPNSIMASQALSLEGDFAKYFDFFAPEGLHIDALTVLAPNFMLQLVDSSAYLDVEFYGNELTFVTRESIYAPEIMEKVLGMIQVELAYLDNLLSSWNYQPLKQPFDTLNYSTFNGSVVKIKSLRLKPFTLIVIIFIGFIIYGALLILFGD